MVKKLFFSGCVTFHTTYVLDIYLRKKLNILSGIKWLKKRLSSNDFLK